MQLSQSQIKNGWKVVKLGDHLEKIVGGGTPSKSNPEYWGGNIPWASVKDMSDNEYKLLKTQDYISEVGLKNSASNFIKKGTVVISTRMGLGRIFINQLDIAINQDLKALYPRKELNNNFLLYSYINKADDIKKLGTGSTVSGVRLEDVKGLEISLPPLPTQEKIACVLSAYDDLIENNDKRIKVLEAMAQKLYTEWFVNFKFSGHEKVKMVDSDHADFGMVPEGWEVRSVGSLANFLNGFAFKPSHLGAAGLPIVKIPELRSGILDKTPRNTGESIPKKYLIENEDILFSWSATLLVNIWNSGPALLNQHLFKVTPNEKYLYSFVYIMLQNQIEKYRGHAVGATMQHLRKDVVEEALVICPNLETLKTFEEIVGSFLKEISILQKENQNLKKSRDFLIPQLVGGRVEVKN